MTILLVENLWHLYWKGPCFNQQSILKAVYTALYCKHFPVLFSNIPLLCGLNHSFGGKAMKSLKVPPPLLFPNSTFAFCKLFSLWHKEILLGSNMTIFTFVESAFSVPYPIPTNVEKSTVKEFITSLPLKYLINFELILFVWFKIKYQFHSFPHGYNFSCTIYWTTL